MFFFDVYVEWSSRKETLASLLDTLEGLSKELLQREASAIPISTAKR